MRRSALFLAVLVTSLATACGGPLSAGPLRGTWHVHTFYLTIQADGSGAFRWPIHTSCASRVAGPCDQISASGVITDGGRGSLKLSSRSGATGRGVVSASTDPSVLPDGPVRLTVGANDVLYLAFARSPAVHAFDYLCGPRTDTSKINCGA